LISNDNHADLFGRRVEDKCSYRIILDNFMTRDSPLQIPTKGVAQFVEELARKYQVTYTRTLGDEWADAVARVLEGEVRSDRTADLLVALMRAEIITGREMVALLVIHRREIRCAQLH
jgi:hypothetical protein